MKFQKTVLQAVIISLVAHLIFFSSCGLIKFSGVQNFIDRSKRMFNIKSLSQQVSAKTLKRRGITYVNVLKFEKPELSPEKTSAVNAADEIPEEKFLADIEQEIVRPVDLKSSEDLLPADKISKKDKKMQVRTTRSDLIDFGNLEDQGAVSTVAQSDEGIEVPREFFQSMPGFTPKSSGGFVDSIRDKILSSFDSRGKTTIKRKGKYSNIGEFLICTLSTFQDPRDNEKYFKISIYSGQDADKLDIMNKEIVFVIDCSLSIQKSRLEQFKNGIAYCLENLNEGDVFNILAFKEKSFWYRSDSVEPDKQSIREALDFVNNLSAGEGTDAYSALYDSLKVRAAANPSYLMFLSDGRPTSGVTNTVKIINEISAFNKKHRPIFAFSGGSRVNRYFLDFISYKNRGWTEYSDRTFFISKSLASFYNKIKDPLLLNLRYYVSSLDRDEMFPKDLPDFFKGAEFTLYGKYSDEEEFSLQLLGDIANETNEFIIVGSMSDARPGTSEIARNWAYNKVYYLISLLEHQKQNQALIDEIKELCEKFDIKTPYYHLIR